MFSEHFWRVYFCGFLLTHTVTHNRKNTTEGRGLDRNLFPLLAGALESILGYMTWAMKFPMVSAA